MKLWASAAVAVRDLPKWFRQPPAPKHLAKHLDLLLPLPGFEAEMVSRPLFVEGESLPVLLIMPLLAVVASLLELLHLPSAAATNFHH